MKRINQRGLTTIEILICFVLIAVISVSMYTTVSSYNNKEAIEASKEKIMTYKNLLTKEIQDDLIKRRLVGVDYKKEEPSSHVYKHVIHLTFADGSATDLIINQQMARDYDFTSDDDQDWPCHNDKYSFEYGDVVYPIPDLGYGENKQTNCPGGTSEKTVKVLDLRIQNVIVSTEDGVLYVKVDFYHVDLPNRYGINIVAPIDYSQGGSIIDGSAEGNATLAVTFDCNGGKVKNSTQLTAVENYTYGISNQKFTTKCEKTGYSLTGWNLAADGSGDPISTEAEVADGFILNHKPSVTVYAQWVPLTLAVTFDCNGGKVQGSSQTSTVENYTYDVPDQKFTTKCERSGYQLLGWRMDNGDNISLEATVAPGYIVHHSPAVTVRARWKNITCSSSNLSACTLATSCRADYDSWKATNFYKEQNDIVPADPCGATFHMADPRDGLIETGANFSPDVGSTWFYVLDTYDATINGYNVSVSKIMFYNQVNATPKGKNPYFTPYCSQNTDKIYYIRTNCINLSGNPTATCDASICPN